MPDSQERLCGQSGIFSWTVMWIEFRYMESPMQGIVGGE